MISVLIDVLGIGCIVVFVGLFYGVMVVLVFVKVYLW